MSADLVDQSLSPATIQAPEDSEVAQRPPVSWARLVLRRLVRNPSAVVGLILVGVIAVASAAAPLIARYDPNVLPTPFLPSELNQLPSSSHPFGTDYLGRDLLARVLYGGRASLPAGLGVVLIAFGIGVPFGTIAGYIGGVLDDLIMRTVDIMLAFPGIILAIVIVTILGPSLLSSVIAVGIVSIPAFARLSRGSTLQARENDYVTASRAQGAGSVHIAFRHIIPNIVDPLIILATLSLGGAILATAALSFIGLGTQPPDANWGTLVNAGYEHMFQSWAEIVFPGLAIVISVLGVNLLGDGLADALNVRI
jgi:ABC-type dipeptide/oligopeptide/nickel transport system permease subunit